LKVSVLAVAARGQARLEKPIAAAGWPRPTLAPLQ
jgi:hypothetical protein